MLLLMHVQECMAATQPFAAASVNQTNATAMAAAFAALCLNHPVLNSTKQCSQAQQAIAGSVNRGKRAAWLCSTLQLCSSSLSSSCLVDVVVSSSTRQIAAALLDNCTVEGLPGGSLVPGGVRTLTPLPIGKCTSASQCGDPAHFSCSTNKATACACSSDGQDTCVELAECQATEYGVCSSCVAQMLRLTQQFAAASAPATSNSTLVAERWSNFCNANSAYNTSTCGGVMAQISSSFAGSLGKQAGRLCHLLGSCTTSMAADGCPIITQLLTGQQVRQTLDLCTLEGVTGGSRVPGVSATAALAPGRCFNSSDCKSEGLECSMVAGAVTIFTCEGSTGALRSSTQGTCVKTACQTCRDCMAATQPFALKQATNNNASKVAEEWRAYCQTGGVASSADCAAVASTIATTGAGNLGKRAAGLCFALGQCNASSCGGSLQLDQCTVQGLAIGGMLVPGVSATTAIPLGRCFSKADCTPPADTCDTSAASNPTKLCTCSNGVDTCSTELLGACAIQGGGCEDCKLCLAAVQPFVKQVLQNATKATTWTDFCSRAALSTSTGCAAVSTSFGSTTNKYLRAGLLCGALQRCTQKLAADSTCALAGLPLLSNGTSGTQARLESCMAEGVTGGAVLPGISPNKTLASGACQNDMQCGSPDLMCDMTSTSSFCYCEGGTDFCLSVGSCKRTPCAVCNDCLDAANRLTEATKFVTNTPSVADSFTKWCGGQSWSDSARCASVNSTIMSAGMNVGKRAGLLCQSLGACNTQTLPATCKLASRKAGTGAGAAVVIKGGQLVRWFVDDACCCLLDRIEYSGFDFACCPLASVGKQLACCSNATLSAL